MSFRVGARVGPVGASTGCGGQGCGYLILLALGLAAVAATVRFAWPLLVAFAVGWLATSVAGEDSNGGSMVVGAAVLFGLVGQIAWVIYLLAT